LRAQHEATAFGSVRRPSRGPAPPLDLIALASGRRRRPGPKTTSSPSG